MSELELVELGEATEETKLDIQGNKLDGGTVSPYVREFQ